VGTVWARSGDIPDNAIGDFATALDYAVFAAAGRTWTWTSSPSKLIFSSGGT